MSDLLKNKLETWAPEPPAAVWQRVQEGLQQPDYAGIAEKLYHLEVPPPGAAWPQVQALLNEPAPVIQLAPRRVWVRYAAGVAAALVLLYFGFNSLPTSSSLPHAAQQNMALPQPDAAPGKTVAIAAPDNKPAKPSAKAKTTFFKYRTKLPQKDAGAPALVQATPTTSGRLYEVVAAATPAVNKQQLERYIVVATAEEAAVKLPKKIYDLFRCEQVPDKLACEERLDNLRMQAAAPSLLATADFAGLLEMVQHVR